MVSRIRTPPLRPGTAKVCVLGGNESSEKPWASANGSPKPWIAIGPPLCENHMKLLQRAEDTGIPTLPMKTLILIKSDSNFVQGRDK